MLSQKLIICKQKMALLGKKFATICRSGFAAGKSAASDLPLADGNSASILLKWLYMLMSPRQEMISNRWQNSLTTFYRILYSDAEIEKKCQLTILKLVQYTLKMGFKKSKSIRF